MGCNMALSDFLSLSKILARIRDTLNGRKTLIGVLLGVVAALRAFGKASPEYPWVESIADTLDYALNAIGVGVDGNIATAAGFSLWGLIDKVRKVGK